MKEPDYLMKLIIISGINELQLDHFTKETMRMQYVLEGAKRSEPSLNALLALFNVISVLPCTILRPITVMKVRNKISLRVMVEP